MTGTNERRLREAAFRVALGVRTVIDLRRHGEVETMGRVPEWAGVTWLHHHLEHDHWDHDTYTPHWHCR